jgi:two-component system, OmpR family, alkaline phosphatase synthesis response regulator PhoP
MKLNIILGDKKMNEKKILIVDDEPDVLKLTSLRLEKLGFKVLTAANGKDALDTIRKEKPDLAMLDLIMPIMYGSEICKLVKSDENLKHIPIILFTAYSEIMTDEKAKSIGADSYIAKPFDARELFNKVEQLLTAGVVYE